MSDKGTGITLHTGGAAGEGADTGTVGAGRSRTSRPAEAQNVIDFLGRTAIATKLRADGEEFMTNVVEEIKHYDMDVKITKIRGDNYEARVLTASNMAFVMIFHDTFTSTKDVSRIPSVSVTKDIIRQMELKGMTEKVIQVLVVVKDLYQNFKQVGAAVVNSFHACDGVTFKDFAIGDFNAAGEIHVSLNLKDALACAEEMQCSPVAHADSGALVYVKYRNKDSNGYGIQDDVSIRPIGVVLGYTDFKRVAIDPMRSQFKFDPSFVVTGIASPIRTMEMGMFLLSVASDVFIQRGMWINAFSSFTDGDRNIGNLFVDPKTHKPFVCKNIQDRAQILAQHFTSQVPNLAVDLQEGCDQFPGLKDIISNPEAIKEAIHNFSGGEQAAPFEIVQAVAVQYDGLVETAKGRVDTRSVDFMFITDPKGPNVSHDKAAPFLEYPDPNDPRAIEKKALLLEDFYPPKSIDLCYTTRRVFLNPDFVVGMARDLSSGINVIVDSWINNQSMDLSGFKRFAPNLGAAFQTGLGNTWAGGFRGFAY